jgi:hypothetical protein
MADKNKKIIFTVEVNDKGKVKVDNLTKGFVNLDSAVKKVNKSIIDQSVAMNQVTKTNQNMIDKTGLAGATIVELGRTISDSNYGIRGMANNISQLSTLFITLTVTSGGLAKGLSKLWSAVMGPLGLILAFQTVIALIEGFEIKEQEAAAAARRTTKAIKEQADALESLNSKISALEQSLAILDTFGDGYLNLSETVEILNRKFKDFENGYKRLSKEQQKDPEIISKLIKAYREYTSVRQQLSEKEGQALVIQKKIRKEGETITKGGLVIQNPALLTLSAINREIQELLKKENRLFDLFKEIPKGSEKSTKAFKAGQLDFEKEIIQSSGRVSESLVVSNELRVKNEFETIRRLAVLKQKDFAEAQQRRVDLIKDEKLKAAAQKKVNKEIADSEKSLVDYIIQLRRERDSVITQMNIEDLSKAAAMQEDQLNIRKKSAAEFNSFLALTNKQRFDADIELEKLKTEIIIQELEQQIEEKIIAGESTIGIEEKIDTLREKLSQKQVERGVKFIDEEAKRINEIIKATQGAFSQLSNVFTSYTDARIEALKRERDYVLNSETLTGEAQKKRIEDIQRRELQAQKNKIRLERELFTIKQSMLIAEQVMKAKAVLAENAFKLDVALSDIGTEAAVQAGKAKMSIGTFVSQGGAAGLAAYAITIGGLLASIFAARKKAKSQIASLGGPSGGSIGGAGGGSSVEAPDFNVVGASPESQLAQSVSEQQTQPLRAFVVHKDIKDANELDRNIDVTRTLG